MPARLADLRTIYADKLPTPPAKPTAAQLNLHKMFAETPAKFMEMLDREERDYRERVDRAWAESERLNEIDRQSLEKGAAPTAEDELLPEEPVEVLIAELLENLRPKP